MRESERGIERAVPRAGVRVSYGMNGFLLRRALLPSLAAFLLEQQHWLPVDLLVRRRVWRRVLGAARRANDLSGARVSGLMRVS